MKRQKKELFLWILLWGFAFGIHAQDASKVSLVNAGQMYVSSSGAANIYVEGGVRMINGTVPVNIVQQGVTKLTGHFYQDCTGHVFATDAAGIGTSTGTVTFFGEDFDKYITTTSLPAFNRGGNYVAFPGVQIDMNKNLILPSRMAADMTRLVADRNGKLWLKSANDGSAAPGRIYDASLRFPKKLTSDADLLANAPKGKIIVEREIEGYRGNTTPEGVMFPFATPFFETQRSGYFAGNWVRRPVRDASYHTEYTYGDKIGADNIHIGRDQYVVDPIEKLVAGQAYLIKPLGMTEFPGLVANYEHALMITGDEAPIVSDYQKTLFVFNGEVYKLPQEDEQLNLMPIFNANVTQSTSQFIRILIGNSYTSSLDLKKISKYMINHDLTFCRYIYIYYPHRNTYVGYDVAQHIEGMVSPPALIASEHTVPAMGVFMLELDKVASTGNIKIDRTFLTHDNSEHNLRSTTGFYDEVLFTLQSEVFPKMQDLSAIGFRKGAKEIYEDLDMPKSMPAVKDGGPILYTLSSDGKALASNSIPKGTKNVSLCVESDYPEANRCKLYISRQESMNTECLLLEDKATRSFIDLNNSEYYDFTLYPGESKDRFVVHFTTPPTGINELNPQALSIFYNKQTQSLEVKGITEKDNNAALMVTDTQGRILKKEILKTSHDASSLITGIYIAKIVGERSVVLKFSK